MGRSCGSEISVLTHPLSLCERSHPRRESAAIPTVVKSSSIRDLHRWSLGRSCYASPVSGIKTAPSAQHLRIAADRDGLTGDRAPARRAHEHDGVGQLLWRDRRAHRDVRERVVLHLLEGDAARLGLGLEYPPDAVALDDAGLDGVDPDARGPELDR